MANILVIGSGGREHALCWRLAQSPQVEAVYCAPGNAGIASDARCVALEGAPAVLAFCREHRIDLVVIGPEQPLVDGLADRLRESGMAVFGPSQMAARLEGSKGFTKALCRKYGIPTAEYGFFTDAASAVAFLRGKTFPIVVKADGLAAGKGVVIAQNKQEAEDAIGAMLGGQLGAGGKALVIEEFLEGEELSFFALTDGKTAIEFGSARDHKRARDGDQGPNTGGMGTYSPIAVATPELRKDIMARIILPTVSAMRQEGCPFQGVLFAGLMLTRQGPKLLEYNARFGDPETQPLMMRLSSDLYPALLACHRGGLERVQITFRDDSALCVVMAAQGYPGSYAKGSVIGGLDALAGSENVKVFHAGTARRDGVIVAAGGRVLGVTALGADMAQARAAAYSAVAAISWPEGFYRTDIGAS